MDNRRLSIEEVMLNPTAPRPTHASGKSSVHLKSEQKRRSTMIDLFKRLDEKVPANTGRKPKSVILESAASYIALLSIDIENLKREIAVSNS